MAVEIFFGIGGIIIAAMVFAGIAAILRQPLIIAYVATGILAGIYGIANPSEIGSLSELGIAFLLFLVGLEMDLRKIRSIGISSTIIGAGQIAISFIAAYILSGLLGYGRTEALFIGLALSFASTMIVVKLLSDKQELDTMHGRMLIGILLVQDFVAIIALTLASNTGGLGKTALGGLLLFACAYIAGKQLLPRLYSKLAKSQELLFLASLSWCFALSMAASSLGYSIAIGAFLAGVSLASLKYSFEISSRIRSLRDFFAIIFFVSLGMHMPLSDKAELIKNAIILTLFVTVLNPFIVMTLMSIFGYPRRECFMTAASMSQISEFSLILIASAAALSKVDAGTTAMISLVAIATIIISSYQIKYSSQIYGKIGWMLEIFGKVRLRQQEIENIPASYKPEVILCGQNRIGYSVCKKLSQMGKKFLVVDYNPDVIKSLMKEKIPCLYGDIGDAGVVDRLRTDSLQMVISTVPDLAANKMIIKKLKEGHKNIIFIVTADQIEDALSLYEEGADYVIMPHFLGGQEASLLLEHFRDLKKLLETRLSHISDLHQRRQLHEHPKSLYSPR